MIGTETRRRCGGDDRARKTSSDWSRRSRAGPLQGQWCGGMSKTLAPWARRGNAVGGPANSRRWDSISAQGRGLAGDIAPTTITELCRDIASGVIGSVIAIAYCVSFSALIFSGELVQGIPVGLNAILLGAGIAGIVVALASSLPRAVGGPDTPVIAVFSALAMSVAASLSPFGSGEDATAQVLVAISFGTLVTGITVLCLGLLRLGVIICFIPFPVVAGFLAASGCLLIAGAFRVSTQLEVNQDNFIFAVTQPSPAGQKLWLAVLLAVVLHAVRLRCRHSFVIPIWFATWVIVVHAFIATTGLSIVEAQAQGWLLRLHTDSSLFVPLFDPTQVVAALSAIAANSAEIAAVAVVTAMAVILNTSGLEALWKRDADLEREFRVTGMANILSGCLGGIAGNISLNRSTLNSECGAVGRLSAVIPGLACLALLVIDRSVLAIIPTPVLAGLLLWLGVAIVINSIGWASPRRDWPELLLVILIMGLIVVVGYLEGLIVGLIGACLVFSYNYSQINIIKHELTRRDRSSNVERPYEQGGFLVRHGDVIRMVDLHGYLFFATSSRVVEDLKGRFRRDDGCVIEYLIIDFRLVTGVDISTVLSFVKLRNACEENGVTLVFCGLPSAVAKVIRESKQRIVDGERVREFASRDEALEWAEESLLQAHDFQVIREESFEVWLAQQVGDSAAQRHIMPYLERLHVGAGEQLAVQGATSDSIDLVASGRVRVMLERADGPPIRLRSMLGHTVLGEMGFFRGTPRTASAIAEKETVVYRLRRAEFDRMLREQPEASVAFHRFIIRVLADRLAFANWGIAALEL